MSYALTIHEEENVWGVYCSQCRKWLGTMSSEALGEAISFAVGKGGVMCPECRKNCCKQCFLHQPKALHSSGICWFCRDANPDRKVMTFEDGVLSS